MIEKDFEKMASYLDEDVHLVGPFDQLTTKAAVVKAARGFSQILQGIEIRSRLASGSQIMIAYDMIATEPIGKFRAAVLMEFTDRLICKIELFFDTKPFGS
jgi:hypothetical protein